MRAKLYYQGTGDGKRLFQILGKYKIPVISTTKDYCDYYITVVIKDYDTLCEMIKEANSSCYFPVIIVKTYKSKKCDTCKHYFECSNVRKLFSFLCVGSTGGKDGSL